MKQNYLLKDVVALLGGQVKPYQITYAISVGLLPEPELRISNKRIFHSKDVQRVAAHFGVTLKNKEQEGGNDGQ